jgi:hypothetical protein
MGSRLPLFLRRPVEYTARPRVGPRRLTPAAGFGM